MAEDKDDRPSYADVVARLSSGLTEHGSSLQELGTVDGYPIYRAHVTSGRPQPPCLLVSAGLHGEEPASVLGLLAWLEGLDAPWQRGIDLTILPCLNPYGYDRDLRFNRAGLDPNRQWHLSSDPLYRLVAAGLADQRFDLVLDLHEDIDFMGFYTYEICRQPPPLGPQLIARVAEIGPIAHGEAAEGDLMINNGQIEPLIGDELEAFAEELDEWPIAFYYAGRHTEQVLTVETPGRQPLELRVKMQQAVLDESVRFLEERDRRKGNKAK